MASTSVDDQSLYLTYDEAVKELPEIMNELGDDEKQELAMFLKQLDQLHKPDAQHSIFSALSIASYVLQLFVDFRDYDFLQEFPYDVIVAEHPNHTEDFVDQLFDITGKIATEVAYDVVNKVDVKRITLKVLNMLRQFSWEIKVSLLAATYILTFGDSGLNVCAESKVTIEATPMFVDNSLEALVDMTQFEKLPRECMKSKNPPIKVQRTSFIIAAYWIIRATVAKTTSHIMKVSSWGDNVDAIASEDWATKLEDIVIYLRDTTLPRLKLLLGL